jgi:hypothetical protein
MRTSSTRRPRSVGLVGGEEIARRAPGLAGSASPDLTSDSFGPGPIIRASRNSPAGSSVGEAPLSAVLDESPAAVGSFRHSMRSTSLAGMRMSLPSRKLASSPRRHICRTFSDEQPQRFASVSGLNGRAGGVQRTPALQIAARDRRQAVDSRERQRPSASISCGVKPSRSRLSAPNGRQPAPVQFDAACMAEPLVAKGIGEDRGAADIDRPFGTCRSRAPGVQPLHGAAALIAQRSSCADDGLKLDVDQLEQELG